MLAYHSVIGYRSSWHMKRRISKKTWRIWSKSSLTAYSSTAPVNDLSKFVKIGRDRWKTKKMPESVRIQHQMNCLLQRQCCDCCKTVCQYNLTKAATTSQPLLTVSGKYACQKAQQEIICNHNTSSPQSRWRWRPWHHPTYYIQYTACWSIRTRFETIQ